MIEYPPAWVVLKIQEPHQPPVYKILAGWYGGYLGRDEWRLNSGITNIEKQDTSYIITGYTGTVYVCSAAGEKLIGSTASALESFRKDIGDVAALEVVPISSIFSQFSDQTKVQNAV